MRTQELILSILAALPDHEIKGKKRVQKISFLIKEAGFDFDANFFLWDFGPFSKEIASSIDFLTMSGALVEREERVSNIGFFVTAYKLLDESTTPNLNRAFVKLVNCLNGFTTIELEVAATLRYFISEGYDPKAAEEKTRSMKPNKAIPSIIARSGDILKCIEA